MKAKFYICRHCGKIVSILKDSPVPLMCCGSKMEELAPIGTAKEKHEPVYTVSGSTVTVKVGENEHPMQEEHHIAWISILTKQGSQIKYLSPDSKPSAVFEMTADDELEEVYAYCNMHGLWSIAAAKTEDTDESGNYIVCKCNNVRYFDILDEIHKHENINSLLDMFEDVKDTTRCSTGCGGCYNKVMSIISDEINR